MKQTLDDVNFERTRKVGGLHFDPSNLGQQNGSSLNDLTNTRTEEDRFHEDCVDKQLQLGR